jgi:hypothetical protein
MSKFKVGDRVKVIEKSRFFDVGDILIIQSDPHYYPICISQEGGKVSAICEERIELFSSGWNGRVTVDGNEYEIVWQHERYDDVRDQEVLQHPDRAITDCQIIKDVAGYGIGHSHCSWSDNFSRKVGRKLSLQRALLNSNFTHEQRRQVWAQVLAVRGLVK